MKNINKFSEDIKFLLELFKLFDSNSNPDENQNNLKVLLENCYLIRLSQKFSQLEETTNNNNQGIFKYFKFIYLLHFTRLKVMNSKKLSFETQFYKELVLYPIYKELEDQNTKCGISLNDIISLTEFSLYDYFNDKEKSDINFSDFFKDDSDKKKNFFDYIEFSKYFLNLVSFIIYAEKAKVIYESLDFEKTGKVLTAELVVCLNKVLRNLKDDDLLGLKLKIFSKNIDVQKIFIKKSEFYAILLKIILN